MEAKSMWPAGIATFVASVMVASVMLAGYTALHLRDTTRKVNNQGKVIHQQQQRIDLLVDVTSAQHDLMNVQQKVIEKMISNEKGLLRIFMNKQQRTIAIVNR